MRVLLDTNVLASGYLFAGIPRDVLLAVLAGDELIATVAMLAEFERVLLAKFDFPQMLVMALRTDLESWGTIVTPAQRPGVLEDPVDDEILGIALAGQAELIVTGDRVPRLRLRPTPHHHSSRVPRATGGERLISPALAQPQSAS